jgi:hypothetical protein
MGFRRFPICIFSLGRLDLLRRTLDSLRHAVAVGGMEGPVALFQDGAWSPASRQYKTQVPAAACTSLFLDMFPYGTVFESPVNLGPAANVDRAERWAFESMRYGAALFFTDDIVVSPRYFRVMARLHALALAQPRIAMFAAYGADGRASVAHQYEHRAAIGPMHHNWAFGLTRDAWARRETLTADYMRLLEGCDYRDRPLDRIAGWYARIGWPPLPTSHEVAKSVALNTLGLARVASVAICAQRIGDEAGMLLESAYPEADWLFDPVDDDRIDAIVAHQRAEAMRLRLGPAALMGSEALHEAWRVIRQLGGGAERLARHHSPLIASVGGLYADRWAYPRATIVFAAQAELRGVELHGIAAQHLPAGTGLSLTLNGEPAGTVRLVPGERFSILVPTPRHLDRLEKVLVVQCAISLDPCSAGYNEDRRPLSFLLVQLTATDRDGTQTVVTGEDLVRDGVGG